MDAHVQERTGLARLIKKKGRTQRPLPIQESLTATATAYSIFAPSRSLAIAPSRFCVSIC